MSKTSSRQRYTQLLEWLEQLKKTSKTTKHKKQSRLDYYQQKGN